MFIRFKSTMRQFALMRFLQFPRTAKLLANTSVALIKKGGTAKKVTEALIGPLTKSFSAGQTVSGAVRHALPFLQNKQQILLDYTEEMLTDPKAREAVFYEIGKLLDEISKTSLLYVPIKLTALIDPTLLEKISQGGSLNDVEKKQLEVEKKRLFQLVEKAQKLGKYILIDQEYPHQKKAIFNIAVELMRQFNKEQPTVYITIQATDVECFELVKQLSSNPVIPFPGVKLVNGAYVDWAHQNGHGKLIQPSKMASFISFVLIAKHCLRNQIHLYMGTHNPLLEKIIDDFALSINASQKHYLKGQLYGFTTKDDIATMYSIFGSTPSCLHYSLRRVIEGAGSHTALLAPILKSEEISAIVSNSGFSETLDKDEIEGIKKAVRFNVQSARVDLARANLYRFFRQEKEPSVLKIESDSIKLKSKDSWSTQPTKTLS